MVRRPSPLDLEVAVRSVNLDADALPCAASDLCLAVSMEHVPAVCFDCAQDLCEIRRETVALDEDILFTSLSGALTVSLCMPPPVTRGQAVPAQCDTVAHAKIPLLSHCGVTSLSELLFLDETVCLAVPPATSASGARGAAEGTPVGTVRVTARLCVHGDGVLVLTSESGPAVVSRDSVSRERGRGSRSRSRRETRVESSPVPQIAAERPPAPVSTSPPVTVEVHTPAVVPVQRERETERVEAERERETAPTVPSVPSVRVVPGTSSPPRERPAPSLPVYKRRSDHFSTGSDGTLLIDGTRQPKTPARTSNGTPAQVPAVGSIGLMYPQPPPMHFSSGARRASSPKSPSTTATDSKGAERERERGRSMFKCEYEERTVPGGMSGTGQRPGAYPMPSIPGHTHAVRIPSIRTCYPLGQTAQSVRHTVYEQAGVETRQELADLVSGVVRDTMRDMSTTGTRPRTVPSHLYGGGLVDPASPSPRSQQRLRRNLGHALLSAMVSALGEETDSKGEGEGEGGVAEALQAAARKQKYDKREREREREKEREKRGTSATPVTPIGVMRQNSLFRTDIQLSDVSEYGPDSDFEYSVSIGGVGRSVSKSGGRSVGRAGRGGRTARGDSRPVSRQSSSPDTDVVTSDMDTAVTSSIPDATSSVIDDTTASPVETVGSGDERERERGTVRRVVLSNRSSPTSTSGEGGSDVVAIGPGGSAELHTPGVQKGGVRMTPIANRSGLVASDRLPGAVADDNDTSPFNVDVSGISGITPTGTPYLHTSFTPVHARTPTPLGTHLPQAQYGKGPSSGTGAGGAAGTSPSLEYTPPQSPSGMQVVDQTTMSMGGVDQTTLSGIKGEDSLDMSYAARAEMDDDDYLRLILNEGKRSGSIGRGSMGGTRSGSISIGRAGHHDEWRDPSPIGRMGRIGAISPSPSASLSLSLSANNSIGPQSASYRQRQREREMERQRERTGGRPDIDRTLDGLVGLNRSDRRMVAPSGAYGVMLSDYP
ncbi:hypothetical protein KIPB_005009 [Kipferlia bialata]|uniref:Uncharacterized protein n=1 Tax=Kipferlia bialata TaxID=797122 RepID=A0A9K3GIL2_9EUKA|nr:hypothetical protein KIPB_005009 [Kipferlia bialata]|eukprot:g5009.t1